MVFLLLNVSLGLSLFLWTYILDSLSINLNCSFIEHIVGNNDLPDSFEFWKSLIKLKWHLHFRISKEAERVNRSVAQGLGFRPFVKFFSALWSVRAEAPQLNIHTTLAVDVNVEVGWKLCERGIKDPGSILSWVWLSVPAPGHVSVMSIRYQSGATPRVKYCDHRRCYLRWRQGLVTFVTGACCHDRPSQHITRRHDLSESGPAEDREQVIGVISDSVKMTAWHWPQAPLWLCSVYV